jgi:HEPN domain-containing protein
MREAKRDLEHARRVAEDGEYEWSCFAVQPSAEKALKAVYQRTGRIRLGCSVTYLLSSLPEAYQGDEKLIDCAMALDRHYLPPVTPKASSGGHSKRVSLSHDQFTIGPSRSRSKS